MTAPAEQPKLWSWDARTTGRAESGVTDDQRRSYDRMMAVLREMPEEGAEGTIRRARPSGQVEYEYGPVLVRLRRGENGVLVMSGGDS